MSAAQAQARENIAQAAREALEGPAERYGQTVATIAVARSLLAAAEEIEALVELLRERLPVPERAESRGMVDPGAVPNALDIVDDAECTRCGVRLSYHGPNVPDHEWIRA